LPHAQALVLTDDPSTLAAELTRRLGLEFETEWSAEAGYVKVDEGVCTFHSWPEGLRLDAFADSGERLSSIEQLIAQHLRMQEGGARLRIEWRRRPLSE
jgi:hypothetical protein